MKHILLLILLAGAVGFIAVNYIGEEEDCPRMATGQCIGTTTGYGSPIQAPSEPPIEMPAPDFGS